MRNLTRNRSRSLAIILAISAGFAAINLFGGYIANVFSGLQRQAIEGEKLGHLTIARSGYFERGGINQEDFILSTEEISRITTLVMQFAEVELVSPRLSLSGLISDGDLSTIFIGDALVRTDLQHIRKEIRPQRGGFLQPGNPFGISVSKNLAQALALEPGSSAVLFTSTLAGQANAYDVDIIDIYDTGTAATNDKAILLSLELARNLLTTEGAERLTVVLNSAAVTEMVKVRMKNLFAEQGLDLEVRTWESLSAFYQQVKNLFNLIFSFIFSIVLVIVVMSIMNTMSMVVIERTREIGTLRSLGMQRWRVLGMFSLEGLLIALVGCALGLLIVLSVGSVVNIGGLSYTPPSASSPVRLLVDFKPLLLFGSMTMLSVFAIVSSFIPARRAANTDITNALRHV
ncbi:MAG: FtsX-like permease family protein [Gammaproteobacteria bacterium]|nr:FtsX-like permease family protein [Gammaproteobacteria bacterium]